MRSAVVIALLAGAAWGCSGDDAPAAAPGSSTAATTGAVATTAAAPPVTDTATIAAPSDPTPVCDVDAALGTPTIITFWHALDSGRIGGQVVGALVDRFERDHPGIVVEVEVVPGYSNVFDRLRDTPADASPDLVMGGVNDFRRLHDSGRFLPPAVCAPALTSEDDLLPVVAARHTIGGELVTIPFNVSTPVLVYDRARFAAAGLDPDDPPVAPDEVRSVVEQLQAADPNLDGLVLYDRSASWLLDQWSAQDGRLLVAPDNGVSEAVTDVVVDTPENLASLRWLQSMVVDGRAMTVGLNESGIDDLVKMIDTTRPGAMTLHTSASLGDVFAFRDALPPEQRWDVGVGPLPGPGRGSLVGGGSLWLVDRGDAAGPEQVGAAWLLADWLMQPAQQAELAAATGYVPVVRSAASEPVLTDRWAAEPTLEVGFRQLEVMGDDPASVGLRVGPQVEVERILELAAAAVIEGADPAAELAQAEVDIAAALDRYGGG